MIKWLGKLFWFIIILGIIYVIFFRTADFFNVIEGLKDICRASTRCMRMVGFIR